jgi:hypothetical protein
VGAEVTSPKLYPLRAGDVLELRDEDYMFGMGDLLLRVTDIHDYRQVRGTSWVFLRGWQLRADDTPWRQRDVLVRCVKLRTRRRRAD